MPEVEGDEEEERSGTTDQQARDQDAEKKMRGTEIENRRAAESGVAEGDKVLLLQRDSLKSYHKNQRPSLCWNLHHNLLLLGCKNRPVSLEDRRDKG